MPLNSVYYANQGYNKTFPVVYSTPTKYPAAGATSIGPDTPGQPRPPPGHGTTSDTRVPQCTALSDLEYMIDKTRPVSHVLQAIPSWRNWLARSTVNREVVGSSPTEGEILFQFLDCFFPYHCELFFSPTFSVQLHKQKVLYKKK